jgi:hypothetical protein
MGTWKIKTINTATHEVTMQDESGNQVCCKVPHEHQGSGDLYSAYLKTQTDAYESKNPAATQVHVPQPSRDKPRALLLFAVAEAAFILLLLLSKVK